MEVNQIYNLINGVTQEVLGADTVVQENLSNVVDIGTQIFNANAVDAYVRSLVNHIGRVIFVDRVYRGGAPSVLMDGWEYGSVLEKITAELPEAQENESFELTDGTSYDPNIFKKPNVSVKFFNKRVTFEIQLSITERQVKQSFSSVEQLNGFISMLYNSVEKSMTVKTDALIMRAINNMIGETMYADYGANSYSAASHVKAVNLLYLYNTANGTSYTAAQALAIPAFIRFSAYTIGLYKSRMGKISSLFNVGGKDRFTPDDLLHVVMLSDFSQAANVYLQSDTYHDEFTRLPKFEEVPYWQGSGTGYDFGDTSEINIVTAGGHSVNVTGVLCVMFDRDTLGVANLDRRVTTSYNPKAEFYNNWYKFEAGYFCDPNENFVVFFAA